jgi:hypothetical protein
MIEASQNHSTKLLRKGTWRTDAARAPTKATSSGAKWILLNRQHVVQIPKL